MFRAKEKASTGIWDEKDPWSTSELTEEKEKEHPDEGMRAGRWWHVPTGGMLYNAVQYYSWKGQIWESLYVYVPENNFGSPNFSPYTNISRKRAKLLG